MGKSYPAIFFKIRGLFLLILREAYLVDLPLKKVKLLIMVVNSHKLHQDLLRVRNILSLAAIAIWEI